MSLQVWLPLNGNLNNQGLAGNLNISSTGISIDASGQIGTCIKTTQAVKLHYTPDLNNSSISLCGWFKFNKSEITTAISELTIDSTHKSPTGNILGNANFGGLGIIWQSNDMYNSPPFSKLYICGSIRTSTAGSKLTSYFSAAFDTWIHICVTFDRDTHKISLYKDGVFVGSNTFADFSDGISRTLYLSYNGVYGGNGPTCVIPMYSNDVRVYDHALSPKEVYEISKGLIFHLPLNDPYIESTENLITTQDCLSSNCYNGATNKYGYGTTTDIYKTTGKFQDKFCTKVYMGTSGNSAYPYVYISNLYVSNGTNSPAYKTLSFDFYTNCSSTTYIIPYKLGSGNSTCTWFNNVTSTKTGTGTNSANILVLPNAWNHITMIFHGTTDADTQWGFVRLGNVAHTSSTSNYWLFANMQLETKDHETGYAGVGGLRTLTDIYDSSGFQKEIQIDGNLSINNNSVKYNYCTNFNGTSYIYITSNFASVKTVSFWAKWNSIPSGSSVVFVDKTSTIGFGLGSSGILCSSSVGDSYTFPKTSIVANTWYHFVIIKTSSSGRDLYINGVKQNHTSSKSIWTYNINQLQIGNRSTTSDGFNGQISDFKMYATILSQQDILYLYNIAASIDNVGNIFGYEFIEENILNKEIYKTGIVKVNNYVEYVNDKIIILEDGSIFIQILYHNNPASQLFTENNCWSNDADGLYSNLHILKTPLYNSLSIYEFIVYEKLESSSTETIFRWSQTSNPALTSTITGKTTISGSVAHNEGLKTTGSYAAMHNGNSWWCACGSWTPYQGGIPGFNGIVKTGYIKLYIKVPNSIFNDVIKGNLTFNNTAKFYNKTIFGNQIIEI